MTARFDTVAVVDWSASAKPSPARPSADAIWIGVHHGDDTTTTYHRTRASADSALHALIGQERAAGRRMLVGFDFPFGYPAGFAGWLTGRSGARAVWDWLAGHVTDGPCNANDRFALAATINARFMPATGPFWGRPAGRPLPHLPACKAIDYPALGLAERRRVETLVPRASPVWKLFTTGSVGSQALMGLPLIARLAALPGVAVWPFDVTADSAIVLAEIYPSLIDPAVARSDLPIKDQAQVALLARALGAMSASGTLDALWDDVPDWPGRADEGWILGAGHAAALLGALA